MFMTKPENKPLATAEVGNLFEDSADEDLDESSTQTKYQQINENLQGIIAFCANKLGSSQPRDEPAKKPVTDQGGYKEAFFSDAVEGDAGNQPEQWGHRDSSLYPEPSHEKVPSRIRNNGPQCRGRGTQLRAPKGMFGPVDPAASEHNLKEFQNLIQNFILANNCGSESSTIPPSRRLQISRVNEFELTADGNNKIVQRQLRPPEIQPGRSFVIGGSPLRNKFRNLSSSPFMPLKCAKCQLEVSKRELETIGRKLKRMQGCHDSSDFGCGCHNCNGDETSGRHFCGGDESAKEWACTCGQNPRGRSRELHKQEKRDSNRSLVSSRLVGFSGSDCFQPCPGLNVYECHCCQTEKMLKHGCAPNFVRHEDTHGKCRDCYRHEMLSDAVKLKHAIDMQYDRQRASLCREHDEGGSQDFLNGFSRPAIRERQYDERGNSGPMCVDSGPALVLELDQSSLSVPAKKSDTIIVDDSYGAPASTHTIDE